MSGKFSASPRRGSAGGGSLRRDRTSERIREVFSVETAAPFRDPFSPCVGAIGMYDMASFLSYINASIGFAPGERRKAQAHAASVARGERRTDYLSVRAATKRIVLSAACNHARTLFQVLQRSSSTKCRIYRSRVLWQKHFESRNGNCVRGSSSVQTRNQGEKMKAYLMMACAAALLVGCAGHNRGGTRDQSGTQTGTYEQNMNNSSTNSNSLTNNSTGAPASQSGTSTGNSTGNNSTGNSNQETPGSAK